MKDEILDYRRLSWPADWAAIFERQAPLWVEIGFGNGHFLFDLAAKHPEVNLLGVEISLPSLRRAQEKLRKRPSSHVRLLQADGRQLFWLLTKLQSVEALYINFPDPWHKPGHNNRRLISDSFLDLAASRMPAGAPLNIAMDHPDYIAATNEVLGRTPWFQSRIAVPYETEDLQRLRTKYELKALTEGRICHYYHWERNDKPSPHTFSVPEELPMPHVVFTTPLTLSEMAQQFTQQTYKRGKAHIRFADVYQSFGHGTLFVETFINEEPVSQRLGIAVKERKPGDFVLSLHEVGFPRPSAGVHEALFLLAEWLRSLHPGAQIIHHNLRLAAVTETEAD